MTSEETMSSPEPLCVSSNSFSSSLSHCELLKPSRSISSSLSVWVVFWRELGAVLHWGSSSAVSVVCVAPGSGRVGSWVWTFLPLAAQWASSQRCATYRLARRVSGLSVSRLSCSPAGSDLAVFIAQNISSVQS